MSEELLFQNLEKGLGNNTNVESLIGALVGIIVDVPLKNTTYAVHLEAVTTLLVLLSANIHSNVRPDQSNIYRIVMNGKHSIHAPFFVKSLLQNFIEQKKPPPNPNQGHSIVLGNIHPRIKLSAAPNLCYTLINKSIFN